MGASSKTTSDSDPDDFVGDAAVDDTGSCAIGRGRARAS